LFVVCAILVVALGGGHFAATAPNGEWRFFSWHPFLMNVGMVGLAGIGAVTKKKGGYQNTKVRKKEKGFLATAKG
jgi:hypothetical protein